MPLYEYKCTECGDLFTSLMNIKNRDVFVGSSCGNCEAKKSIIRIPSSGSFKIHGYAESNGYNKQSTKRK